MNVKNITDARIKVFLFAACVMGFLSMVIYTVMGEYLVAFVIAPLGAAIFGLTGYVFIKFVTWLTKGGF